MRGELEFDAVAVRKRTAGWVVCVPTREGTVFEYRYRTRSAARFIAEVFRLRPSWFPEPHRIARARSRRGRDQRGSSSRLENAESAESSWDAALDQAFALL